MGEVGVAKRFVDVGELVRAYDTIVKENDTCTVRTNMLGGFIVGNSTGNRSDLCCVFAVR